MSTSFLEENSKSQENNFYQKKLTNEMDNFWDDCIDPLKLNDNEDKKNNNVQKSNKTDEDPEDYITCKITLL